MGAQRRIHKILLCVFFVTCLAGCESNLWDRYPAPSPTHAGLAIGAASGAVIGGIASGGVGAGIGVIAGGVLGASFGNIIESHYTLVEKLQYSGVEVIIVGDEIKLILPTDRFFQPHSPLLNYHYTPVMNMVGEFLRQFQKVSIRIAGFTDDAGSWRRNLALSRSRARAVMRYLWSYGIDTRLIYAVGEGGKYPIANNATAKGRRLNRRVEITLQKLEN